ncbi:MAG: M14 family zinc carboxypeptidase [Solirubrobacteraceae bacterium]
MRRWALTALVVLAVPSAAQACSPTASPDPSVPGWRSVNGFALGSKEATPAQIERYLLAVDRASGRVRTFTAGRSGEGRPLRYAAIGTPAHLARLGALAAEMRGLRAARYSAERAAAIARTRPLFAWIGGSVHGNEPSGGDADMALLARLAGGRTCADVAREKRLVVFLLPVQNPDGRAHGVRYNARRFDLNRDWFARTQPETQAKIAALTRFPPVIFADQHEEGGTGFFFPPNADPIHHEISRQALSAINHVVAPALRRGFKARGIDYTNFATYDMFFMGYGDTVPTTLYGAAGMTFEKGAESPYGEKTAEHLLAADRALSAAAGHRRALLQAWGAQWREARAQGARGVLQPNRVVQPGNEVRFRVPDGKVYGYVLRSDAHAADAAALVERLTSVGVVVRRLGAETAVPAYRGYGEPAAGPATLPAGTYLVSMAQAGKHWVQGLLGEDPYVPFPYFYDVSGWSNPLLMGLRGGLLTAPLPAGTALDPITAAPAPAAAPAYAFAGGAEGATELAFALLDGGVTVTRTPDGGFAATGDDAVIAAAAHQRHVALAPLSAMPGGAALRRPAVAMLQDVSGDSPAGWMQWLLETRYGLGVGLVGGEDIAGGALAGKDVLVIPGGAVSVGELSSPALATLQAWVRAGGTLVGARGRGVSIAQAAGLTAVTVPPSPALLQIPGVVMRVALDPSDPVAAGEDTESYVFNDSDPLLAANGTHVVVRYPQGARFFTSGHASGTTSLEGTPAATDEVAGSGRVVLFAFDPVFRGYVEATDRLLGNALLAPRPLGAATRSAPRAIEPGALVPLSGHRDTTIQVAAGDEAALLAATRAAGVPAGFTIDRDLTTVTLRLANPQGLDAEQRPWTRRLPAALAAAGVVPLLAVF